MQTKILVKSQTIKDKIIEIRRTLHRNPELAFQEHQTAKLISEILKELGYEVHDSIGGTGVVAEMGEGRVFALRAAMDAVALQEQNQVDYISQNPGVMHANAHDAEVACLLGAAVLLAEEPIDGRIRLIFQPGEETTDEAGLSGAARMIQEGTMQNVNAILGLRVTTSLPAGVIGLRPGAITAASDDFRLMIYGRSAHGARPHEGVDAIAISAQLITAFQQIVSRRTSPLKPTVISVSTINGNSKNSNIVSDQVEMSGTIRSFDERSRQLLRDEMRRTCELTRALGGDFNLTFQEGYPVTQNDQRLVELLMLVARDLIGRDKVVFTEPELDAEDFALLTQKAPGGYFFLGAGHREGPRPPYQPFFDIDESQLHIGAALLAEVARRSFGRRGDSDAQERISSFLSFRNLARQT
jgi:amidohydrolase